MTVKDAIDNHIKNDELRDHLYDIIFNDFENCEKVLSRRIDIHKLKILPFIFNCTYNTITFDNKFDAFEISNLANYTSKHKIHNIYEYKTIPVWFECLDEPYKSDILDEYNYRLEKTKAEYGQNIATDMKAIDLSHAMTTVFQMGREGFRVWPDNIINSIDFYRFIMDNNRPPNDFDE